MKVASATDNTHQDANSDASKSIDGDLSTIYHSKWSDKIGEDNPAILTYNFKDVELIDYVNYVTRQKGVRGKIFVLDGDVDGDGIIDFHDIKWQYLEGDGDFRSREVTALRDEADIIVTDPPCETLFCFVNEKTSTLDIGDSPVRSFISSIRGYCCSTLPSSS